MKKTLFPLFIVLCIFSIGMHAQGAKYGVRAGLNLSSINFNEVPSSLATLGDNIEDSRIGVVVGFLAEFNFGDKLSLQPEIQFSTQGNKEEEFRTNYLQFPVFVKYHFTDMFNVHVGPQLGIKIWEWERNENYGTFDIAGVIGIGAEFLGNFFVDVRYALGLTNVFDDENFTLPNIGNVQDLEGKSSNIQLSVGFKL